jgi:hypothetical protein
MQCLELSCWDQLKHKGLVIKRLSRDDFNGASERQDIREQVFYFKLNRKQEQSCKNCDK